MSAGVLVVRNLHILAACTGHTVAWVAVNAGRLDAGGAVEPIGTGELAMFEESGDAIDFVADGDTAFVLGSAVKHPHDLVMGYYSVRRPRTLMLDSSIVDPVKLVHRLVRVGTLPIRHIVIVIQSPLLDAYDPSQVKSHDR